MVDRNAPCPCGSGKKYKHCCLRTAGQAKPDDVVYLPNITPKLRDLERRQTEFWRPLPGGRVACDLCYRLCELDPDQAGWCKIRRNEDGHLVSEAHGVLASMVKQQRGYQVDPFLMYKPGERSIFVGLTYCTAGCKFCMSKDLTWRPESVEWTKKEYGRDRILPDNSWWYGQRARYTPEQVIDNALRSGARHVEFGINEPTLTWEFTFDVARLAKARGLDVLIESNGFTAPAAIRALAPYVDAVDLGIKGSADPVFYERWMRSPGAVPHVLEAARTWRECGVRHLLIGDLVAPSHMQDDRAAVEAQKRLYNWIVHELGELTPVLITGIMTPGPQVAGRVSGWGGYLLARGGDEEQMFAYQMRMHKAKKIAIAAGLLYAHQKNDDPIPCHSCGAELLRFISEWHCEPCTMAQHFCILRMHEEHVTEDGRCEACGAQTPIVVMSAADRRRYLQWRATTPPGESIRTERK